MNVVIISNENIIDHCSANHGERVGWNGGAVHKRRWGARLRLYPLSQAHRQCQAAQLSRPSQGPGSGKVE